MLTTSPMLWARDVRPVWTDTKDTVTNHINQVMDIKYSSRVAVLEEPEGTTFDKDILTCDASIIETSEMIWADYSRLLVPSCQKPFVNPFDSYLDTFILSMTCLLIRMRSALYCWKYSLRVDAMGGNWSLTIEDMDSDFWVGFPLA